MTTPEYFGLLQVFAMLVFVAVVFVQQVSHIKKDSHWNEAIEKLAASLQAKTIQTRLLKLLSVPLYAGSHKAIAFTLTAMPKHRRSAFLAISLQMAAPKFKVVKALGVERFLMSQTASKTGSAAFGKDYFVTSAETDQKLLGYWSKARIDCVRQLFALGCLSIQSNGKVTLVRWSPFTIAQANQISDFTKALDLIAEFQDSVSHFPSSARA